MTTNAKRKILQAVSNLLHPLFMLTYGTAVLVTFTVLSMLPVAYRCFLVGEVFFYTCLIPSLCIYLLYKLHIVGHWALRNRADRAIPLGINAVAYTFCAYVLALQQLPLWALSIYYGGVVMAFAGWVVSFWWKISAHAMGIASLTTASFGLHFLYPLWLPLWLPFLLIILSGLLCSIRLYLGRHTLAQVAVGSLVGVVAMSTALLVS